MDGDGDDEVQPGLGWKKLGVADIVGWINQGVLCSGEQSQVGRGESSQGKKEVDCLLTFGVVAAWDAPCQESETRRSLVVSVVGS